MVSFNDVQAAARMRDLVEKISTKTVEKMRPEPRLGYVHHYDSRAQAAWIRFRGDEDLVMARTAENMVPTRSIETHGEVNANIVRVAGKPGSYYVMDYIRGGPKSLLSRDSLHSNPDFELGLVGGLPTDWSDFWNTGGITARVDDSVYLAGRQSCKVTIPATAGAYVALQCVVPFSVTANEVIEIGVTAVSDNPKAQISVEMLSAPLGGDPNYFGSGAVITVLDSYLPGTLRFSSLITKFEVPATHVSARLVFRVNTTDGSAANVWIDDTNSKSRGNPYVNNTGDGLWKNHSPNWPNCPIGIVYHARSMRIGNTVFVQERCSVGAAFSGTWYFAVPNNWIPASAISWEISFGDFTGFRAGYGWAVGTLTYQALYTGITPNIAWLAGLVPLAPAPQNHGAMTGALPTAWAAGEVMGVSYSFEAQPVSS